MPYLKSSSASRGIIVEAADVNTTLSVSAPSTVQVGQSFSISGILIRNDTGGPIIGASISLKYNGTSLGSATTGVDGDYLKTASIPIVGSHSLQASFGGLTVAGLYLSPSNAEKSMRIMDLAAVNPLLILGALALGYMVLKK